MRKHYIDYLRVLAILAVITIHITVIFYAKEDDVGNWGWWLANIMNSACRFSVPLFVMISGAVLLGRPMNVVEFYKKRFIRLFPAFVFWNIFYLIFNFYTMKMDVNSFIWFAKIELFVEGRSASHLWYLTMIICLMLFAPFVNLFLNGDKPTESEISILLAVMFLFFFFNSISSAAKVLRNVNISWFKGFPWYLAYFISGYYFDKYGENIKIKNSYILITVLVLTILGATLNYYAATSLNIVKDYLVLDNNGPFVFIIASLIFLAARKNTTRLSKIATVSAISEASFGIYLIHPIFIYILVSNLLPHDSTPLLYIPVGIFITTLASLLTVMLIRRFSFMRLVL